LKWRSNDKSTQYLNIKIKEVIFKVTNWHLKFGGEMKALIPVEMIEQKILMIRGEKVMLDSDLAELYGVEVKHIKGQVRIIERRI